MIKNYLKIAFRQLYKKKIYSIINIGGLALGLAAFLLILEFVSLERSVNQFHANLPNMYRVMCQNVQGENWPQVEPGWAEKVKEKIPEIKSYCRFPGWHCAGYCAIPVKEYFSQGTKHYLRRR